MKPFDLAGARKGAPICTKDGHAAEYVGMEKEWFLYPVRVHVVAAGAPKWYNYTPWGKMDMERENTFDLMMVEENDPPLIGEKYIQHFDND